MAGEWKTVRVQEIAKRTATGPFGSAISSKHFTDSGVPVIRGSNLSQIVSTRLDDNGLVFVSEEKAREFSRSEVRHGDLVFTCWGTIDQVGLIDSRAKYERYIVSNKQMLLTPDDSKADSLYLYYYFASPDVRSQILNEGIGSSVPGFNLGQLRSFEIPLPPLPEQKRIAEVLGALDDKIELNRRMNATLEATARALFQSWFVDFDPVRAKLDGCQPSGMDTATADLFPDSFEESALGHIPKGWEVKTAHEVSTVGIGKTPPRKEHHWFSENPADVPWMSIRDLGEAGVFISHTSEFLTTEAVEQFRVRRIPDNTVVLSFKLTMGRVAITDGEMLSNEAIAHFRLNPETPFGSAYLYCYLKGFGFDQLGSTSSIATAINSDMVRGIKILVPFREVADAFERMISPLFAQMKSIQKQSRTLAALRDTLLPKLLTGELSVSVLENAERKDVRDHEETEPD